MLEKSNIVLGVEQEIVDTDCEEALDVLIESINKEGNLTYFGELAAQYQIRQHLNNRSLIQKTYKTLDSQKVSKPIIVIGLPRSGTTFLFNLLSKDESNRSPLFWEMMKPLPLVKKDSISITANEIKFIITDFKNEINVTYNGAVPNLFEEEKGVVAEGFLKDRNYFSATKILAKHDENYMPPEVKEALKEK